MNNKEKITELEQELSTLGKPMFELQLEMDNNRNNSSAAQKFYSLQRQIDEKQLFLNVIKKFVKDNNLLDQEHIITYASILKNKLY